MWLACLTSARHPRSPLGGRCPCESTRSCTIGKRAIHSNAVQLRRRTVVFEVEIQQRERLRVQFAIAAGRQRRERASTRSFAAAEPRTVPQDSDVRVGRPAVRLTDSRTAYTKSRMSDYDFAQFGNSRRLVVQVQRACSSAVARLDVLQSSTWRGGLYSI